MCQYLFLEHPTRQVIQDHILPPPTDVEKWAEDDAVDNKVRRCYGLPTQEPCYGSKSKCK
jgi:hypothetical protein